MTKTNVVALTNMELDMVAGGGLFDKLKEMREAAKIKDNESTPSEVVIKGNLGTGLVGFLVGRILNWWLRMSRY